MLKTFNQAKEGILGTEGEWYLPAKQKIESCITWFQ